MDWLQNLFLSGHGVASGVVVISLVAVFGLAVGEIKIGAVKLGIAGPLFIGIAVGHYGLTVEKEILEFAREFGLILFVYGVGVTVGPNFLEAFKKEGVLLNALAAFIVITGGIVTVGIHFGFDLPLEVVVGLFSGGTTNTPSLAAGMQMLTELNATPEQVGVPGQAYAVAYPFGVIGILLTMGLVRVLFRINVEKEGADYLAHSTGNVATVAVKERNGTRSERLVVTATRALGKRISDVSGHGVTVTALTRGNAALSPDASVKLRFGDYLTCVGTDDELAATGKALGNDAHALQHTPMLPIFLGIMLGVLLGSVPLFIPGLPAPLKLGLAGGPVVVAIILSRIGHIGPVVWYMPSSATNAIREIGITMFMCCVGIFAGGSFISTLVDGDGLKWMACATLITLIPIVLAGLFARAVFKLNYLTICGVLSGSMTDPPALAFANAIHPSDAQATAYATVYPLTMCLRILAPQVILAAFWAASTL